MDAKFITDWFGVSGAVFVVILGLFKAIWPKIENQLNIRSELKRKENELRIKDQQYTKDIIEAVKVTNELVAKNNEAFTRHNTIFDIHIEMLKNLRDDQRLLKSDMHRRFDDVEDQIQEHHSNAIKIESIQSEIVAGLRNMYGIGRNLEVEKEISDEYNQDQKL